MAKKISVKSRRTINQRFTSLERLVRAGFRQTEVRSRRFDSQLRGFQRQTDLKFRLVSLQFRNSQKEIDRRFKLVHLEFSNIRKDMNERFEAIENRIDRLTNHVDGFIKLHETLDIE